MCVLFREAHHKVYNVHLLLIGHVIFIKVKSGLGGIWFLHGIVTIIPFATNNLGRHSEILQISCSSSYFPHLDLASSHKSCQANF